MSYPISQVVAVTSITFSFILVGIITAISPLSKNTSNRYKKLSPSWQSLLCCRLPSTFFAWAFSSHKASWTAMASLLDRWKQILPPYQHSGGIRIRVHDLVNLPWRPHAKWDWRLCAVATAVHVITIVRSAVNMQPINNQHRFHPPRELCRHG